MEMRRNGASHFLSFVGDYMFQTNKPFVSKRYYVISAIAGVAVGISGLLLLNHELERIGFGQLYSVSRTNR